MNGGRKLSGVRGAEFNTGKAGWNIKRRRDLESTKLIIIHTNNGTTKTKTAPLIRVVRFIVAVLRHKHCFRSDDKSPTSQ
jgi:hypothetical protein